MGLKNSDFVEIEYVGYDKETDRIFDLTDEELAKKEGIFDSKMKYGPLVICVGEGQVLGGLDEFLVGKEEGKEYEVDLTPEQGFGKRDPKLMKLVPSDVFKKENIRPFPGLRLNLDGLMGVVRTVSGGRIIVDFNHILAGHNLMYKLKIGKKVTDEQKKLAALLGFYSKTLRGVLKEGVVEVSGDIPKDGEKFLKEKIKKLISKVKEVKFAKTTTKK